jgi:hypothetical protein
VTVADPLIQDFGCATNGNCDTKKIYPPVKDFNGANNYPDGIGQMKHFHDDLGMNFFRLPVGWQYLVNNNLGGNLDSNNLAQYDKLVQGCRSISGAQCIIDIHNYGSSTSQSLLRYSANSNLQLAGMEVSSAKEVQPTTNSSVSGDNWPPSTLPKPTSGSAS